MAEIEFADQFRSAEERGGEYGWPSEFDVKEFENMTVDLGVPASEVLSDCSVGGGPVTGGAAGVDIADSLRMISTMRMLTGKRMSRHA